MFSSADGKAKATIGGHTRILLKKANWMKLQLFGFSEQLPQMAKIIRGNISAGRWSWLWDRVAVQAWVRAGKLPQNFSMAGHSLGGYLAAIVVGFLA